jgi:hypothetical protein
MHLSLVFVFHLSDEARPANTARSGGREKQRDLEEEGGQGKEGRADGGRGNNSMPSIAAWAARRHWIHVDRHYFLHRI